MPVEPQDGRAPSGTPLLELTQISKHFGGVRALHEVDLSVRAGEVVALIGDNGAGKSTLVKVMSGVESPDTGEIRAGGEVVRLDSPRAAADAGIHTVFQDLSLCDNLDAVQNLFLGHERCGPAWTGRRIRRHVMEEQAQRVLESLSVKVRSLTAPVSELSGGQRQGIAICRACSTSDPAVVLLDEPTAALGVSQRAEVLDLVGRLREQGRGVVVISHDMKDVQKVADRIVALRLGSKVAEFDPDGYTPSEPGQRDDRCARDDQRRQQPRGGVMTTTTPPATASVAEQTTGLGRVIQTAARMPRSIPVLINRAAIWAVFYSQSPFYLSFGNLTNLTLQIVTTAILSLGIVFVLLVGEIDLSSAALSGSARRSPARSSSSTGCRWPSGSWPRWLSACRDVHRGPGHHVRGAVAHRDARRHGDPAGPDAGRAPGGVHDQHRRHAARPAGQHDDPCRRATFSPRSVRSRSRATASSSTVSG